MIPGLAKRISGSLYQNKIIEKEEIPIYQYGYEIFLSTLLEIIAILLLGHFIDSTKNAALFVIVFMSLRFYCGGYHASTYVRCQLITIGTYFGSVLIKTIFHNLHNQFYWLVLSGVIYFFIIFFWAPMKDKNKEVSGTEREKFKKISRLLVAFWLIAELLFQNISQHVTETIFSAVSVVILLMIMKRRIQTE